MEPIQARKGQGDTLPEDSIPRELPADLRHRILYANARELYRQKLGGDA